MSGPTSSPAEPGRPARAPLRIFYAAMKYDYGKPEQGFSFEHWNFYESLRRMGHHILYFDFMSLLQERGRDAMNRRLAESVRAEKPDLLFTVLFTDEFDPAVIRRISDETDTVTMNWFCDDHWRFEAFSAPWAPCFNWVITTAASALPKYERAGIPHVIKSQWACNTALYRPLSLPLVHDVSFVGQPHGNRREVIRSLEKSGITVRAWGQGWPAGRIGQEEMIRVFNQSRINLNLTNASIEPSAAPSGPLRRWASRTIAAVPLGPAAKTAARRGLSTVRHLASGRDPKRAAGPGEGTHAAAGATVRPADQIKGRNFEIPGCGGFLLTSRADDLEAYYEPGREIACFEGEDSLIDSVRHFLTHEKERASIARAGLARTLREHSYAHRFHEIFGRCGLTAGPTDSAPTDPVQEGRTEMIGW